MEKVSQLLESCDKLIKAGEISEARKKLSRTHPNDVPPRFRATVATLCRRTGLVQLGLKFLTPKDLYDRENWIQTVPAAEAAEYAILVQRMGSIKESLTILNLVENKNCPEVFLYRSFCYFAQWEHEKAVEAIETYLGYKLPKYSQIVAKVNLASAYLGVEDFKKVEKILTELLQMTETEKLHRLHANCLEISARLAFQQQNFKKALQLIARAEKILGDGQSIDSFLIEKIKFLIQARSTGSKKGINKIKEQAKQRHDWESLRDLDYQSLFVKFSKSELNYLFFGTPYKKYKQSLVNIWGAKNIEPQYTLGNPKAPLLDLQVGTVDGETLFRSGGMVHKTLAGLLRDFYRPVLMADLFKWLYPDEYFNIFSSPDKVQQSIRHTRIFLEKNHFKANIVEDQGSYYLNFQDSLSVLLPQKVRKPDWNYIQLAIIANKTNQKTFLAKELQELLNFGKAPFWKFVSWACENGTMTKSGAGPATRYTLNSNELTSFKQYR